MTLALTKSELRNTFRGVSVCTICPDTVFLFGAHGVSASDVCAAFLFSVMMIAAMIVIADVEGDRPDPSYNSQGLESSFRAAIPYTVILIC